MDNIKLLYEHFKRSTGISTDTRSIQAEQIFFALRGENFNGNKYAQQALANGALICVIDDPVYNTDPKCFLVEDSLKCLQDLANYHRKSFNIPLIAITGSNGKTTTKELCAAVLSEKYKLHFTRGNLNNHIGVPLTLLEMTKDIEIAIIEMGANHQNEIRQLCEIAEPTHGYITNIGKAHLEGFGGLEGVLKGKTEMYDFLKSSNGTIVINSDDALLMNSLGDYHNYEAFDSSEYCIEQSETNHLEISKGSDTYRTQLFGAYNLSNVAVAIKIGEVFSVDNTLIKRALEGYLPEMNRSQNTVKGDYRFILDAYNANPSSMAKSIESFAQSNYKSKVLILGEMLELGEFSFEEHQNILSLVSKHKFDHVWLIGAAFKLFNLSEAFKYFESVDHLIEWSKNNELASGTVFLIKGSRANQLEKFFKTID